MRSTVHEVSRSGVHEVMRFHTTYPDWEYPKPVLATGSEPDYCWPSATLIFREQVICEHARKHGRKGQYSTSPEHVPPAHQNVANLWSRTWFLERARGFGPATVGVITQILDRHVIEAQGYLDCQNILDSLGKKGRARLEAACQQVLNTAAVPTYTTLKRVLATITSDQHVPSVARAAANTLKPEHPGTRESAGQMFIRDSSCYQEGF